MARTDGIGGDAHPNDDLLIALHDGVLFSGDRPGVEGHLKTCARCRARLKALTEDITPSEPAAPAAAPALPRSISAQVWRRLGITAAVLALVATAGIAARWELNRRSTQPVSLATAPTPEPSPVPTITNIPEPPQPEPAVASPDAGEPAPSPVPPLPPEPLVISSPNRNFRWRVTGLDVERTSDGGDVWRKQNVALARTVVAGTAPSAAVCWLVGQAGSVFLAVGSEWKDVSMTRKVDLVKVAAIDSMNATVTASDGTLFSTSDAGVTWTALTQ